MLNEALKEIILGEGTDFRIDEHNFQDILQMFKGIVEFDDFFEKKYQCIYILNRNDLDIYKQDDEEYESSEESVDSQSQIP